MASLKHLWQNRARFPITSLNFYRAWAKRLITLKTLLLRNWRRKQLNNKGALIAFTAEIGIIKASGRKRNLTIDNNTFIGNVEFALHDKITIGKNVCINDGVILLTASHDIHSATWDHKKQAIIVEDYAWIATNAIILPGVTIGRGAVVGAGAVVSKNIEPYIVVAGNPAKPTGKKRIEELNYNPCEWLATNRAWLKG